MSIDQKVPTDPYDAVLADLRSQRDRIDQTIALLEGLRGGVVTGVGSSHTSSSASAVGQIEETAGMFLGMSIVDASKKLLLMRKRTLGNPEIAKELQAGGLVLNSREPANVVGSVLTRRFNDVGDVVKVGRGIWGLKEWYPNRNFKPASRASQVIEEVLAETDMRSSDANQAGQVETVEHAETADFEKIFE